MSERSLDQFNRGDKVEGKIFYREPNKNIDVRQVSVTYNEYYTLIDQTTQDKWSDGTPKTGYGYSTECSLPEGAEWNTSYSLKESTHSMHDIKLYTFEDVYDITRSTPNNMELGAKIREMVNDSDE
tara:strand:- start:735 stop:1112 length:378 start_codon:yes stop_codon:yes gene_type:complete